MTRFRAAFAFTAAVFRILSRDRQSLFFMLVLPVVVIVVIGTTFGGQDRIDLGVTLPEGSQTGDRILEALTAGDGIEIERFSTRDELASAVRHRSIDAGLYAPDGLDEVLEGDPVQLELLAPADERVVAVQTAVTGALDEVAARINAAVFASSATGVSVGEALSITERVAGGGTAVEMSDVGGGGGGGGGNVSEFSLVVPQNLVLFTFINATASAAFLVRSRRDGVLRRALAAPTGSGTLLTGLAIGWFCVALLQSMIIVVVGRVAFDMRWGDPVAAGALIVVWALVGCGAGLLVGAIGQNEDRVGAIAPVVGITLGALGGCMVPFEVFSETMQRIALVVPHTWALTGWRNVVFDGGGFTAVAGSLAVLTGWAVALVGLAAVLLRRRLVE